MNLLKKKKIQFLILLEQGYCKLWSGIMSTIGWGSALYLNVIILSFI